MLLTVKHQPCQTSATINEIINEKCEKHKTNDYFQ